MSKYIKLTLYLGSVSENIWNASFEEVESVIGQPLPNSAREYQAWWSNQQRSQSLSWQSAGWKTANVDIANETVSFIYVGDQQDDPSGECIESAPPGLSIAEAKIGLAISLGVSPDQIEIIVRG